jgi:hypothetical protein
MAEIKETKEVWEDLPEKPRVTSMDGKPMQPVSIYINYTKYNTKSWEVAITIRGVVINKDNMVGKRRGMAYFAPENSNLPEWVREYVNKHAPKELTDSGELWAGGVCNECGSDSDDSELCEACTGGC